IDAEARRVVLVAVGGAVVLDDEGLTAELERGGAGGRLAAADGVVTQLVDGGHRRGAARIGEAAAGDGALAVPQGGPVVGAFNAPVVVDVGREQAVLDVLR